MEPFIKFFILFQKWEAMFKSICDLPTPMNKLLAIAMVAAVIASTGFTPAFAANPKVDDTHTEGEDFAFSDAFCGVNPADVYFEFNEFYKEWANGHYKIHLDGQFNIYDGTGLLIGTVPFIALNEQGNVSDLPVSYQLNFGGDGTCIYTGETITGFEEFHCGATLHRDGTTTVHTIDCL